MRNATIMTGITATTSTVTTTTTITGVMIMATIMVVTVISAAVPNGAIIIARGSAANCFLGRRG
jgi:hypothetical protein